MEYHSEFKSDMRDQQPLGTSGKPLLPQASQSIKLQDRLKPEKPRLSYADLHNEITGDEKDILPKSCHDLQKQWTDRKATKEDELVKYMSNLPSYLERGENQQEKVLNVGVLDWGRLEKWRYSHKQVPDESSQNSPSSSITSSSFWTDGSSAPSSRGQSCSPAHPRTRRPSLQSHLMASSIEGHSQEVKLFGGSIGKFQDLKPSQSSILLGQAKVIRTDPSFCSPVIKKEECRRKVPDQKIDQESRVIPNAPICTKEKAKIQDGEIKKRVEKLREPNPNNFDQDVFGKHKTVVLLLPRDLPQKHHSAVSQFSELTTSLGRRSMEASRKSFSQSSNENYHAEVHSDIPHSCPLPCEVDSEHSLLRQPGTVDKKSVNVSSVTSHPVPLSAKVGTSPSKSRNLGEKRSTSMPTNTTNEPLKVLDVKVSNVADEKVRSSSPFRRLNISLGKMSKSSSSKDGLDTHRLNSKCAVAKSGSEKAAAFACLDTSNTDNLNTSRARSSPLRRLLDPLLKPKAANCHHFVEPVERESITKVRASKNSSGQLDSSTVPSGKLNLDTPVQALLQVAIKNGQPLFKFAVDNDSNILAATMKKLNTTRKGEYSTVYTFFTIQVKKKNGSWINQGGKSKGKDQFSTREFVLFSVDLRQADQQTFDFQPNDELAAVVVNFPKSINRSATRDGCQSNHYNDLLEVGSKEQLPGVKCYSNTGENVQKLPSVSMKNLVNATVILPSAAHSIPSKGGPSSLIERWKSGGLCDCGGWDLGCKLRILANQNHISNKLGSSKACSVTDKFELFCQEGVQVNQPFLSLSQYKDGIYSVEFSSLLSILQAFSICIAVLDSRKACELSESSDF
ncbi:hypothetical protein RGQ29_000788 [Quercus rubra]|uniref:DUF3527 domain protein n=1 Tax=Quercus rubra TaxID=3512 RepID=A0AAN7G4A6_QUERU|nr:hypothetical protein RGQ29_000788 [Quercus rubra]